MLEVAWVLEITLMITTHIRSSTAIGIHMGVESYGNRTDVGGHTGDGSNTGVGNHS